METKLKGISFWFDEDSKELIIGRDKVYFAVPKKYLFSLSRFLIRISQKGFYRKLK